MNSVPVAQRVLAKLALYQLLLQ